MLFVGFKVCTFRIDTEVGMFLIKLDVYSRNPYGPTFSLALHPGRRTMTIVNIVLDRWFGTGDSHHDVIDRAGLGSLG